MRIENALNTVGVHSTEELPRQARWTMQKAWRSAFASDWHDWSGPLLDMDWHVFSYKYVEHMTGAEAVAAFEARSGQSFIVSVDLAQGPTFKCTSSAKLDYMTLRNMWSGDLYLMNEALDWTFVLTHEQDLGPYFVERADCSEMETQDVE